MLRLSLRDRDRLVVLRQVVQGSLRPCRGAERLSLSRRHFRRLLRRFEAEGDEAVIHRARGRPSNHRILTPIRQRALERAREPLFHDFGPTLLAEHLSRDPQIGRLNPHTLRRWLIEAGHWKPHSRGARHRKARPRRAAVGELIQLDTSEHAWLEDRYPGRLGLIKAIDDASNRLLMARFVPRESGVANRQLLIDYLRSYGRPLAFYTDRATHFGNARRHASRIPREQREAQQTNSIIQRALQALGIELVFAHSPQAKGRIERDFGTSQDRLVKELRVAGISTLDEANRFLEELYIPFWNERFAVRPADPTDLHRPLPEDADLERLFAETLERTIGQDYTIRYRNQKLQVRQEDADGMRPGQKIVVEHRLDGSTHFRWQERYLSLEAVAQFEPPGPRYSFPKPAAQPANAAPAKPRAPSGNGRRKPRKPGPNHPWRQYRVRLDPARPSLSLRPPSPMGTDRSPQPPEGGHFYFNETPDFSISTRQSVPIPCCTTPL